MAKRLAGINCKSAGTRVTLSMQPSPGDKDRKRHPADGASAVIITNRYNGVLVELINDHGIYRHGAQLQVSHRDLIKG